MTHGTQGTPFLNKGGSQASPAPWGWFLLPVPAFPTDISAVANSVPLLSFFLELLWAGDMVSKTTTLKEMALVTM